MHSMSTMECFKPLNQSTLMCGMVSRGIFCFGSTTRIIIQKNILEHESIRTNLTSFVGIEIASRRVKYINNNMSVRRWFRNCWHSNLLCLILYMSAQDKRQKTKQKQNKQKTTSAWLYYSSTFVTRSSNTKEHILH